MPEQDLLLAIDGAIARARFHVYELMEINEELAESLDASLQQATVIVNQRLHALSKKRQRESEKKASASGR